jgi:hypothetical protein
MLVGIVLILLGTAGGLGELVPERYRRRYRLCIAIALMLFGVVNLIAHEQGSNALIQRIDRYGTVTNWQASAPTLKVEGPASRKEAHYSLAVKVIPKNHQRVRTLNLRVTDPHSRNEPAYLDDTAARWLFWVMADTTGAIDIKQEHESGIYTYYYSGRFDPASNEVRFRPDAQTYWPSLFASLRDLEGKFVIARILASGVDRPQFTELRIEFESPAGSQLVVLLPKVFELQPSGKVLITSRERYIGGLLRNGRFLPKVSPE